MHTTDWETCLNCSHFSQFLYKPFLFFCSPLPHPISPNQWPFRQLGKLGFQYTLPQLLSLSNKMTSSLPIPSSVLLHFPIFPSLPWPLVLIWMPSGLIWDLILTFPLDCVFVLTSLMPNSLWPWNIQVSPDLTTLQLDSASHWPPSCSPHHLPLSHRNIWKEWFVLKDVPSPPLTHSSLCNCLQAHPHTHTHTALSMSPTASWLPKPLSLHLSWPPQTTWLCWKTLSSCCGFS